MKLIHHKSPRADAPLRTLVENAPTGLLVVDASARILYANTAAATLLDRAPKSITGTTLDVTLKPEEPVIKRIGAHLRRFDTTPIHWQGRAAQLVCVSDIVDIDTFSPTPLTDKYAAIHHLGELVLNATTPAQLRQAAATLACDALGAHFGLVVKHDPATLTGTAMAASVRRDAQPAQSYTQPYNTSFSTAMTTQLGYSVLTHQPSTVENWQHDTRFEYTLALSARHIAASATVAIPHTDKALPHAWGVLGVYSTSARDFSASDVAFLQSMANMLAQAMQRARILEDKGKNEFLLDIASRTAKVGGLEVDLSAGTVHWSKEVSSMLGLTPREMTVPFNKAMQFIHDDYIEQARTAFRESIDHGKVYDEKYPFKTATGHTCWVRSIAEPVYDDSGYIIAMRGALQDITATTLDKQEIKFLALYDPLTRLPNRHYLEQAINTAIDDAHNHGTHGALLLFDLDNFKTINDIAGHDVGDNLLCQISARTNQILPAGDFCARFAGAQFAIILNALSHNGHKAAAQARTFGHKLLATLSQPYYINDLTYHSTQCIGMTLFGFANDATAELVKQADLTMHAAKQNGRGQLRIFDPELQATVRTRAALEHEMRYGLLHQQFIAHYQAQVDANGAPIGAELLARWRNPQRGYVSPAQFIPIAENSGLILDLGQIMLDTGCAQLARWANNGATQHLRLSINISMHQLRQPQFVETVKAAITAAGADATKLILELTESSVMDNVTESVGKIKALRDYGVRFSLDDFGTGYSSLYYLKHLPLSELKIDKGFVRNIQDDKNNIALVRTIMALAHAVNLRVIAEGVETAVERDTLATQGCKHYQGFFYARPCDIDEFSHTYGYDTHS